jgi:hypothetical protein
MEHLLQIIKLDWCILVKDKLQETAQQRYVQRARALLERCLLVTWQTTFEVSRRPHAFRLSHYLRSTLDKDGKGWIGLVVSTQANGSMYNQREL